MSNNSIMSEGERQSYLGTAHNLYAALHKSNTPVGDIKWLRDAMREAKIAEIELDPKGQFLTFEQWDRQPETLARAIKGKIRQDFQDSVKRKVGTFDIKACEAMEREMDVRVSQTLKGVAQRMIAQTDGSQPPLA